MKQSKLSMISLGLALTTALTACVGNKAEPVVGDGYATANFMTIAQYKAMNIGYAMLDPNIISSPEHVNCITELDREEIIPDYQEYLKKHLSKDELKIADELYGSELGSRINDMNEMSIDAMGIAMADGKPIEEVDKIGQEVSQPTEEDKEAIKEFLASETGKKISSLTRGDLYHTDGFSNYTYPKMSEAFNGCYVELPPVEDFLAMVIESDEQNYPKP